MPVVSPTIRRAQVGDVKKLKAAGLHTVDRVAMTSKRKLGMIKGISEAKAEKISDEAIKMSKQRLSFKSALDLQMERERNVKKITTGSAEFDAILGGGVETGAITMIYGENRTGKSQIAVTLCIACFQPEQMGGAEGKAVSHLAQLYLALPHLAAPLPSPSRHSSSLTPKGAFAPRGSIRSPRASGLSRSSSWRMSSAAVHTTQTTWRMRSRVLRRCSLSSRSACL